MQHDWIDWLTEAHAIIAEWERAQHRPLLQVIEASDLAERIARALAQAFARGKAAG